MRYYSHEELKDIISYYIQYWIGNTSSSDEENLVLSKIDLNVALDTNLGHQKPIKFSEFKNKYKLLINDYFTEHSEIVGDLNLNSETDKRYPLIVIFTHTTGEPDMMILSEHKTIIDNFDSDDLEIIMIDMIQYPVDEELFQKFADFYNIEYDPEVYRK